MGEQTFLCKGCIQKILYFSALHLQKNTFQNATPVMVLKNWELVQEKKEPLFLMHF